MDIVPRIKHLCAENGLNIKSLEVSAGLGNGTIRRWDEVSPSVDKLAKVADILHSSLDFLFYGRVPADSIASSDQAWLNLIHALPEDAQNDFRGAMRLYIELHGAAETIQKDELRDAK